MKHLCKTCDWFEVAEGEIVVFNTDGDKNKVDVPVFECHKNAPDMDGFPPTREDTGCGEHSALSRPARFRPTCLFPGPSDYERVETKDAAIFGGSAGGGKTVSMGAEMKERLTPEEIAEMGIAANREGLKQERIHDPDAFEVGDRVRVTGKAEDMEGGWMANWPPIMDEAVGKTASIYSLHKEEGQTYGFALEFEHEGSILYDFCVFPSFVLEKVTDKRLDWTGHEFCVDGFVFKIGDRVKADHLEGEIVDIDNKCRFYPIVKFDLTPDNLLMFKPPEVSKLENLSREKVTDDPKPEGPPNEEYSP